MAARKKLILVMDYDNTIIPTDAWKAVLLDIPHNKAALGSFLNATDNVEARMRRIIASDAKTLGTPNGVPPISWFADSLNALDRQHHLRDKTGAFLSPGGLVSIGSGIEPFPGFVEFLNWVNDNYNTSFYIVSTSPLDLIRGSVAGNRAKRIYATELYYHRTTDGMWYIGDVMSEKLKPWAVSDILDREEIDANTKLICLGDGATDLYMFRYARERGGHALLVYQKDIDPAFDGLYDAAVKADYKTDIPTKVKAIMES